MCYPFYSIYFGYVEFSILLLFREFTNILLLYVKHNLCEKCFKYFSYKCNFKVSKGAKIRNQFDISSERNDNKLSKECFSVIAWNIPFQIQLLLYPFCFFNRCLFS